MLAIFIHFKQILWANISNRKSTEMDYNKQLHIFTIHENDT